METEAPVGNYRGFPFNSNPPDANADGTQIEKLLAATKKLLTQQKDAARVCRRSKCPKDIAT
jgi:hypothetical protein